MTAAVVLIAASAAEEPAQLLYNCRSETELSCVKSQEDFKAGSMPKFKRQPQLAAASMVLGTVSI